MAATAAALFRSAWQQQLIHASSDLCDLSHTRVNIVHVRRPGLLPQALQQLPAQQLMHKPAVQAVIDACRPEPAVEYLAEALQQPDLQQQVQHDLLLAAQHISTAMRRDHVRAKLELVQQQNCPRFHADSVGIRLLVSYAGPGTWFVDNRHVRRDVDWWTGDAAISWVDEQQALQAGAGDLLFLKGHAAPGMRGAGAVHKSPEVAGGFRLLLTVDDACC